MAGKDKFNLAATGRKKPNGANKAPVTEKQEIEEKSAEPEIIEEPAAVNTDVEYIEPETEKKNAPAQKETIPAVSNVEIAEAKETSVTEQYVAIALQNLLDPNGGFKKKETRSENLLIRFTPSMGMKLDFLAENNMITNKNDFIVTLVEENLNLFFQNKKVLKAFEEYVKNNPPKKKR